MAHEPPPSYDDLPPAYCGGAHVMQGPPPVCPRGCGPAQPDARFCMHCGAPVAPHSAASPSREHGAANPYASPPAPAAAPASHALAGGVHGRAAAPPGRPAAAALRVQCPLCAFTLPRHALAAHMEALHEAQAADWTGAVAALAAESAEPAESAPSPSRSEEPPMQRPSSARVQCPDCGFGLPASALARHRADVHAAAAEPEPHFVVVPQAPRRTATASSAEATIERTRHRSLGFARVACPLCGFSLPPHVLDQHIRDVHEQ